MRREDGNYTGRLKTELYADEDRLRSLEVTAASLLSKREELNNQAERWRKERDHLNESVMSLRAKGLEEKEERDQLNQRVAEIKKRIDKLRLELESKRARLSQLDEELRVSRGKLPQRRELEQELSRIEWTLSTTPTLEMQGREADLTERARELKMALEEHEKLEAQEDRRLVFIAESKAVDVDILRSREEMKELHEASQEHHEGMIQLFRKADEEREKADKAHNSFLESVSDIKEVNAELDRVMGEARKIRLRLREANRLVATKRERTLEERKRELTAKARRKLEAGEKLSLEELKLVYGEEEETPNR